MPNHTGSIIHRRPDGSIDFDHYDRVARDQRAHDQRAALARLAAPMHSLVGMLWHGIVGLGALASSSWWPRLCRARFSAICRR